jgi:hypothetical protein
VQRRWWPGDRSEQCRPIENLSELVCKAITNLALSENALHNVIQGAPEARIPQPDAEGEAIRALREDLREWVLWDAQAVLEDLHRF